MAEAIDTAPVFVSSPLPLSGPRNVRDLGGYPVRGGGVTKRRQFLRADSLHTLTDADKEALAAYGVVCVLDMRDDSEAASASFSLPASIEYRRTPMFRDAQTPDFSALPPSMRELYIGGMLEGSRERVAAILRAAGEYADGCVLFNCTAGKDRTGIIAMLLLSLAGVPERAILRDYGASEKNLEPVFRAQREQLRERGLLAYDHLFTSDPREMEAAIRHIEANYGSAEEYCQEIGLTAEEIARLREKLL